MYFREYKNQVFSATMCKYRIFCIVFAFLWCRLRTSGWRFVSARDFRRPNCVRKYAISRKFPAHNAAHNRKNSAKMGLTKDGLKTVHYVLFSAIYSIIYHLVSFSPDGIQEVSGFVPLVVIEGRLGLLIWIFLLINCGFRVFPKSYRSVTGCNNRHFW